MGSQGQLEEGFNKCVLVTGGSGFIRSHIALQLLEDCYEVYIIDNLDKSVEEATNRVRDLVVQRFRQNLHFFLGDLCNKEDVEKVFSLAKGSQIIAQYYQLIRLGFEARVLKRFSAQLSLTALTSLNRAAESELIAVICEHKKSNLWAVG